MVSCMRVSTLWLALEIPVGFPGSVTFLVANGVPIRESRSAIYRVDERWLGGFGQSLIS
ncbi:uncharacterized protein BDV14DRAFT_164325 [Aspergillus stella-maris]|uniref:uncharacterized protein n=1 Tax=Aspergillus stella-maris TaxID=1810926 RepID=UPI003CCCB5F2